MKFSKIPVAQQILLSCVSHRIKHVVISPGSRNAPLTLSFAEHPEFKTYSIVDERAAAFFALGLAQQLNEPVAILCSSGSALLNYYPAVAEAFYSDIPLVVISADRPVYRIDIGDGQTIRQDGVFDRHIIYAVHLKQDIIHNTAAILKSNRQDLLPHDLSDDKIIQLQKQLENTNEISINQALTKAREHSGPVHINVPFEEPLYETVPIPSVRMTTFQESSSNPSDFNFDTFEKKWRGATKKMILVGCLPPNLISPKILDHWASDPSVVVLTETTSNLQHPKFFGAIDRLITPFEEENKYEQNWEQFKPDLLLTIGGMVVSKKIKNVFREYKPQSHWHIDDKKAYDTFYCGVNHLRVHLKFLEVEHFPKNEESHYFNEFDAIEKSRKNQHRLFLKMAPFSDLKVFDLLTKSIPAHYQLQLANSSPIRYAQLMDYDVPLHFFANRGTSGIDGSMSTAIGAAQISQKPVLHVSGDLSFLYDSNALWNKNIPNSFRLLVVNNGGGGIFRILPGEKKNTVFEEYFETKHKHTAKQLAKMYGFKYLKAESSRGFRWQLKRFFATSKKPILLEVFTPNEVNPTVLKSYFQFLNQGAKF